ncbi:hypothetical protein [Psychromonas sp.]|uniref:hypothetical protein n=1 Tax=Psychromonas sp. TaxID=1884585 RepID=UPI0035692E35
MNDNNMIFIGVDTHKDFNEIAYCEDERSSKPIHQGRVPKAKQAAKIWGQVFHFPDDEGPDPCSL